MATWLDLADSGIEAPSRVVSYDSEDEEEYNQLPKRNFVLQCESQGDILLLCSSRLAIDFSKIYLLDSDKSANMEGEVMERVICGEGNIQKESKTAEIRKLVSGDKTLLIAQVTNGVDLNDCNQFVDVLLSALKPEGKVIILTSGSVAEYLGDRENFADLSTFSKILKSSKWNSKLPKNLDSHQLLDRPNVVSGVEAAVLTNCHFNDTPGLLVKTFVEVLETDSMNLADMKRLTDLALADFAPLFPSKETSLKRLKIIASSVTGDLYL